MSIITHFTCEIILVIQRVLLSKWTGVLRRRGVRAWSVNVCVCGEGDRIYYQCLLLLSVSLCLRQDLSVNPELTDVATLADQ